MVLIDAKTAKRFRPTAQRCRTAATLGIRREVAATLTGLRLHITETQGSLRQPWAGGRNRFAVSKQWT